MHGECQNILFDYFQVNVYHLDTSKTIYDIYLETAIKLGLCSEDAKLNDYISRGEFSFLVNSLKNNTIVLDTPEWLKDFPIISSDGLALSKYYKYLDSVPHVILEEFKNRNWTLDISPSNVGRLNTEENIIAVGWTDYFAKSIYINAAASIVHEMGHFLDFVLMFPFNYLDIYEIDSASFVENFMNSDNIPETEYFATYFNKYISSKKDIELAEELKTHTPTTYEYFVKLEQNNWGL